jgi:hypothetical protein
MASACGRLTDLDENQDSADTLGSLLRLGGHAAAIAYDVPARKSLNRGDGLGKRIRAARLLRNYHRSFGGLHLRSKLDD